MSGMQAAGNGKVVVTCPSHQPNSNFAKRSHGLFCWAPGRSMYPAKSLPSQRRRISICEEGIGRDQTTAQIYRFQYCPLIMSLREN
jgi:hypothetical protein